MDLNDLNDFEPTPWQNSTNIVIEDEDEENNFELQDQYLAGNLMTEGDIYTAQDIEIGTNLHFYNLEQRDDNIDYQETPQSIYLVNENSNDYTHFHSTTSKSDREQIVVPQQQILRNKNDYAEDDYLRYYHEQEEQEQLLEEVEENEYTDLQYTTTNITNVNASTKNQCKISVLSFNLWYDKEDRDERFEKFCNLVQLYNPTIVCLQEVSNLILQKMLKMEWCKEYFNSVNKIDSNRLCGEVTLSKFPFENKEHFPFKNTAAGNYINIADIHLPLNFTHPNPGEEQLYGDKITIVNTQLEKLKTFSEVRKDQFNSLISFLLHQSCVFIVADTNFTDEDSDILSMPEPWKDAFVEFGSPSDQRNTYDSEKNTYINGFYQYRFDRMIYKSRYWKLSYFELIGQDELISTHFGTYTEFTKY